VFFSEKHEADASEDASLAFVNEMA